MPRREHDITSVRCRQEELESPLSHQKASGEEQDYHSGEIGKFARYLNERRSMAW
jgi:hypothetical protein